MISLDGCKVVLPRCGADEFWQIIHEHYSAEDVRKWKYLAMLALREAAGWPLAEIGYVFGHPKGHVSRCLEAIKAELREQFHTHWEELGISLTSEQGETSLAELMNGGGHADPKTAA